MAEVEIIRMEIAEIILAVNNLLMAKQVEKGNKDDSNDH
jgi:hypothetical protein